MYNRDFRIQSRNAQFVIGYRQTSDLVTTKNLAHISVFLVFKKKKDHKCLLQIKH